jgi:hypothetical protein
MNRDIVERAQQTHQWTIGSIGILYRVVTMIPRTPILHGSKSIIETVSRSDWTLSYAVDTVHVHRQPLSNPVPMNTGSIVRELVFDDDGDVLSILSVWSSEF